jgi:hypothetical protein
MIKPFSTLTLVAAAAFVCIVAVDGKLFPVSDANATDTRPASRTPPASPELLIIPIEELQGPEPMPCAVEVCSSNPEPGPPTRGTKRAHST